MTTEVFPEKIFTLVREYQKMSPEERAEFDELMEAHEAVETALAQYESAKAHLEGLLAIMELASSLRDEQLK